MSTQNTAATRVASPNMAMDIISDDAGEGMTEVIRSDGKQVYHTVNVNINGVVKNLMVPLQDVDQPPPSKVFHSPPQSACSSSVKKSTVTSSDSSTKNNPLRRVVPTNPSSTELMRFTAPAITSSTMTRPVNILPSNAKPVSVLLPQLSRGSNKQTIVLVPQKSAVSSASTVPFTFAGGPPRISTAKTIPPTRVFLTSAPQGSSAKTVISMVPNKPTPAPAAVVPKSSSGLPFGCTLIPVSTSNALKPSDIFNIPISNNQQSASYGAQINNLLKSIAQETVSCNPPKPMTSLLPNRIAAPVNALPASKFPVQIKPVLPNQPSRFVSNQPVRYVIAPTSSSQPVRYVNTPSIHARTPTAGNQIRYVLRNPSSQSPATLTPKMRFTLASSPNSCAGPIYKLIPNSLASVSTTLTTTKPGLTNAQMNITSTENPLSKIKIDSVFSLKDAENETASADVAKSLSSKKNETADDSSQATQDKDLKKVDNSVKINDTSLESPPEAHTVVDDKGKESEKETNEESDQDDGSVQSNHRDQDGNDDSCLSNDKCEKASPDSRAETNTVNNDFVVLAEWAKDDEDSQHDFDDDNEDKHDGDESDNVDDDDDGDDDANETENESDGTEVNESVDVVSVCRDDVLDKLESPKPDHESEGLSQKAELSSSNETSVLLLPLSNKTSSNEPPEVSLPLGYKGSSNDTSMTTVETGSVMTKDLEIELNSSQSAQIQDTQTMLMDRPTTSLDGKENEKATTSRTEESVVESENVLTVGQARGSGAPAVKCHKGQVVGPLSAKRRSVHQRDRRRYKTVMRVMFWKREHKYMFDCKVILPKLSSEDKTVDLKTFVVPSIPRNALPDCRFVGDPNWNDVLLHRVPNRHVKRLRACKNKQHETKDILGEKTKIPKAKRSSTAVVKNKAKDTKSDEMFIVQTINGQSHIVSVPAQSCVGKGTKSNITQNTTVSPSSSASTRGALLATCTTSTTMPVTSLPAPPPLMLCMKGMAGLTTPNTAVPKMITAVRPPVSPSKQVLIAPASKSIPASIPFAVGNGSVQVPVSVLMKAQALGCKLAIQVPTSTVKPATAPVQVIRPIIAPSKATSSAMTPMTSTVFKPVTTASSSLMNPVTSTVSSIVIKTVTTASSTLINPVTSTVPSIIKLGASTVPSTVIKPGTSSVPSIVKLGASTVLSSAGAMPTSTATSSNSQQKYLVLNTTSGKMIIPWSEGLSKQMSCKSSKGIQKFPSIITTPKSNTRFVKTVTIDKEGNSVPVIIKPNPQTTNHASQNIIKTTSTGGTTIPILIKQSVPVATGTDVEASMKPTTVTAPLTTATAVATSSSAISVTSPSAVRSPAARLNKMIARLSEFMTPAAAAALAARLSNDPIDITPQSIKTEPEDDDDNIRDFTFPLQIKEEPKTQGYGDEVPISSADVQVKEEPESSDSDSGSEDSSPSPAKVPRLEKSDRPVVPLTISPSAASIPDLHRAERARSRIEELRAKLRQAMADVDEIRLQRAQLSSSAT